MARVDRWLLRAGVAAPLVFVGAFLVEGATRPDYSSWQDHVSQLSLSALGWIHVVVFLVTGALQFAFALGVRRATASCAGTIALLVYASSLVGLGLFATDPSFGYPPGEREGVTLHGEIHSLAGLGAFVSVSVACFALAGFVRPRALGIAAGVVTLVLLVASSLLGRAQAMGAIANAPVGLVQRVSICANLAFLFALALRLLSRASGPAPTEPRSA